MTKIAKYIQPFLEEVNDTVKSGMVSLVYNIHCARLQKEIRRCKKNIQKYELAMEQLHAEYQSVMQQSQENIILNIEEMQEDDSIRVIKLEKEVEEDEEEEEEEEEEQ